MQKRLLRDLFLLGTVIALGSGCVRTRVIEQLRKDEYLLRRQAALTEEIKEQEKKNKQLKYEVDYMDRRQAAGERETAWWKVYGNTDLKRCFEAVNSLIAQMEGGSLQGLYSAYYGGACRKRSTIDRSTSIIIADMGNALDQPIKLTTGMTYVEDATLFRFLVLRPMRSTSGKILYKVVWVSSPKSTAGGKEEKWFFRTPYVARQGDVPAIHFPGAAGIYADKLKLMKGKRIGKVAVLPRRSVPEVDTLLTIPASVTNTQYSFALMGVPAEGGK